MNPRILLIDDQEAVLDAHADTLGTGYEFGRARSQVEALALLDSEGPWDVVLLDERLNGPGGGDTAASLIVEIAGRCCRPRCARLPMSPSKGASPEPARRR